MNLDIELIDGGVILEGGLVIVNFLLWVVEVVDNGDVEMVKVILVWFN